MNDTPPADPSVADRLAAIERRLERGDRRMASLDEALALNTAATNRVEANTADLVEFFMAMQGAFKVFSWIGKAARPLGWIATAVAGIVGLWAALKGHK